VEGRGEESKGGGREVETMRRLERTGGSRGVVTGESTGVEEVEKCR